MNLVRLSDFVHTLLIILLSITNTHTYLSLYIYLSLYTYIPIYIYIYHCRLYCEEISFGDNFPIRSIASGLREHYTLEQMLNRKVIVVCNLKDAKLQGFISQGMVLACKNINIDNDITSSTVELLTPPEGSCLGERIFLDGIEQEESWPINPIKKYKVWETVVIDLKTNNDCIATWKGYNLMTSSGVCTVASNSNNQIF